MPESMPQTQELNVAVPSLSQASALTELSKRMIRTGLKLNTAQPLPRPGNTTCVEQQFDYCCELTKWLESAAEDHVKRLRHIESVNQEQALQIMARLQESEIDSLTGLPNRRAFDRRMAQSCNSAEHSQCPLALIVFDIDHFKLINDTRGHHAGDAVLRGLSHQLRAHLPENSMLARIGGEEFVLLLAGASYDQAIEMADSLRITIAQTSFTFEGQRIAVTISCGMAQVRPSEHAEQTLRRADTALYAAKQGGRNRTYGHDGQNVFELPADHGKQANLQAEYSEVDLSQDSKTCPVHRPEPSIQPLSSLRTSRANWCDSVMLFWYLRQRIAECLRNGDPLCLMAIELDSANSLTRDHGIAAYHFMLRAEMLHLDANLRDMDVLSRTCQSKILAVLPKTELAAIGPLLERLRKSMDKFVFPALGQFVDYSISLGVTQLTSEDCVQTIIQRAEKALLAAQAHGPASFFGSDAARTYKISDRDQ